MHSRPRNGNGYYPRSNTHIGFLELSYGKSLQLALIYVIFSTVLCKLFFLGHTWYCVCAWLISCVNFSFGVCYYISYEIWSISAVMECRLSLQVALNCFMYCFATDSSRNFWQKWLPSDSAWAVSWSGPQGPCLHDRVITSNFDGKHVMGSVIITMC